MIAVKDFSLGLSYESGQPLTFHADYSRNGKSEFITYSTKSGMMSVESRRSSGKSMLSVREAIGYGNGSAEKEMVRRFGLNDDLGEIYENINTDPFMAKAIGEMRGMRVTRNDPWETTLCFLISQFNNMKRIRLIIKNMQNAFGKEIQAGDGYAWLFPEPGAIADASLESIRKTGTGFRDKYVRSVANAWIKRDELEHLDRLDYVDAKEALMQLDGIGEKVADCILLFGYEKHEAFPIDTWVKRVVESVYFNKRKKSFREIHEFAEKRWKGYAGYAQQYLFYYGRSSMKA